MTTPTPARAPRWFANYIIATLFGCGFIIILGGVNALAEFAVQAGR